MERIDDTMTPDKFTLKCERREDGGLRVCSDDIPGLILSGDNVREVLRDVAPAIHGLMVYVASREQFASSR